MQSHYPFAFEREMGCTVEELRTWLPGAGGGRAIEWREDGATLALGGGHITLHWQPMPARRIALMSLPRLRVRFKAAGVPEVEWQRFMRHFDLYTQRGGG